MIISVTNSVFLCDCGIVIMT